MNDLTLIVTATAAVTAAVCIAVAYLRQRAYRRTLATVRAQRDRYRAEVWELRGDLGAARGKWLDHVSTAIAQATIADPDEPIAYTIAAVDRAGYLPTFTPGRVAADLDSVTVALTSNRRGRR